jgi:hypothetical protein
MELNVWLNPKNAEKVLARLAKSRRVAGELLFRQPQDKKRFNKGLSQRLVLVLR